MAALNYRGDASLRLLAYRMKMFQTYGLTLAIVMALTVAASAAPPRIVLGVAPGSDTTHYIEYYIMPEMAGKLPAYYPLSQDKPPLSMRRAIEIGLQTIQPKRKPPRHWRLVGVDLINYYGEGYPSVRPLIWYYIVTFSPENDIYGREDVYILMDGSLAQKRIRLSHDNTTSTQRRSYATRHPRRVHQDGLAQRH